MLCTVRSFENASEDKKEEWLQGDASELGFQNVKHPLSMLPQNKKVKKRVGVGMTMMKDKAVSASVSASLTA
jgi:hypothetical protein